MSTKATEERERSYGVRGAVSGFEGIGGGVLVSQTGILEVDLKVDAL